MLNSGVLFSDERPIAMSDYSAISGVSLALRELLNNNIHLIAGGLGDMGVELRSPKELQEAGLSAVSVWLYRISQVVGMNKPPEPRSANEGQRTDLAVELHYLVTPVLPDPVTRQTVLGRVLQVFHDNPVLSGGELEVNFEALTLQELSGLWEALSEPYQVSVGYVVRVVRIESGLA